MTTHQARLNLALSMAALFLLPTLAFAGTVSATLTISATVVSSCSVVTQPLTLSPHASGSAQVTGTASAGSIDLRCTRGLPVAVSINQGPLIGPGGETLAYTLNTPAIATGAGAQIVSLPVTGTVDGGQSAPAGDYSGEALVTLTY